MNEFAVMPLADYVNSCDKIREKTDTTENIKSGEMPEKINEVYEVGYNKGKSEGGDTEAAYNKGVEAGKKAEYDKLWDNLQQKGTRQHYVYAFAYTGWNDKIFNPKYPIAPTSTEGISFLFTWNVNITDTKVPITAYGKAQQVFYQCINLKRIPKLIWDRATNVSNMFYNCIDLEELYCEGVIDINGLNLQWSTKLSHDSLMSIINCLQDKSADTSGTTWKVIIGSVNMAKLTDEELDIAYQKGWDIE